MGRLSGGSRVRIVTTICAGAVLVTSGMAWAGLERFTSALNETEVAGTGGAIKGEAVNILLVGSDDRTGLTREEAKDLHVGTGDYGRHTDTIILLHLAADGGGVTALSIPRDSLVTIPAYTDADGDKHPARQNRINASFSEGGPDLVVAAVEQATGIDVNHYVEVNFQGFLGIVDALDGVPVCVPKAVKDQQAGLDLPAGTTVVSGKQALAFVRARHISANSDFGRIQRQQQFLSSMVQKATSLGVLLNPLSLNNLIGAAGSSLTTDSSLADREQLLALAERLAGVDPKGIQFLTVPVADGDHRVDGLGSTVLWDEYAAKAIFQKVAADQPVLKAKTAAVQVAPAEIKVQVANGTGTSGLGAQVGAKLADLGFQLVTPAQNADPTARTTIRYDPQWDVSVKTLRAAVQTADGKGPALERVTGLGSTFELVVGADYAGLQAVKVVAKTDEERLGTPTAPRTAADDICS